MIPEMYFDFGEIGSYIIYFVIFFLLEYIALCIMNRFEIKASYDICLVVYVCFQYYSK